MVQSSEIIQGLVLQDAKLDFIKLAVQFFDQASAEGRLDDFLSAVHRIYVDRWPDDGDIDADKVYPISLSLLGLLTTSIDQFESRHNVDILYRGSHPTLGNCPLSGIRPSSSRKSFL